MADLPKPQCLLWIAAIEFENDEIGLVGQVVSRTISKVGRV